MKNLRIYNKMYSEGHCFRYEWEGQISIDYKIPKYISMFEKFIKDNKVNVGNTTVLEIGAGDGIISKIICSRFRFKKYFATELSDAGVKKIKKNGISSRRMNAEDILFGKNSFDIVICFDVMHHVDNPDIMASEMLRVSKKYIFLIESNAFCFIRKIMEKTEKYRSANEKSYSPNQYKLFFLKLKKLHIKPFLFIFPNTPSFLSKIMIEISEIIEKIPFIKWQGSSVLITGEK